MQARGFRQVGAWLARNKTTAPAAVGIAASTVIDAWWMSDKVDAG